MAFASLLLAVSTVIQAGPEIPLPAPTGTRTVGVATYTWTDSARVDTMASPQAFRTVLGRVWYPARRTEAASTAPYAEHLDAAANEWTALHARVRTHSYLGVPFADGTRR